VGTPREWEEKFDRETRGCAALWWLWRACEGLSSVGTRLEAYCADGARGFTCGGGREVEGGIGVGEGAKGSGLSCEPLAPPGPETDHEPDPAAPRRRPVDKPGTLEERFDPGGQESVEDQGLEIWLSSACFLLQGWLVLAGEPMYGVVCEFPEFEPRSVEFKPW